MSYRPPHGYRPRSHSPQTEVNRFNRPQIEVIPYDPGDSDLIHINSPYRPTIYPEDRKLRPELLPPAGIPNPIYYPYQRINHEDLGYARAIARCRTHPALQQNLKFTHPRYELPGTDAIRFPRLHYDPRTYPRYYQWG